MFLEKKSSRYILVFYEFDNIIALWLDYMAIDIKFQNAGYGTLPFNKIAESKQEGILGIFLEVEIAVESEQTIFV